MQQNLTSKTKQVLVHKILLKTLIFDLASLKSDISKLDIEKSEKSAALNDVKNKIPNVSDLTKKQIMMQK